MNEAFETWEPDERDFDAVVAFTSWHWLDPATAFDHAADLLRPGGALAIVATHHVLPAGGDPFFADVQADYEAVLPDEEKTKAGGPPLPEAVPDLGAAFEASGRFDHAATRRHVWDVEYTADTYLALLDTYSGHRALDEARRADLYERIRRRIEARPHARVRKTNLATLDADGRAGDPGARRGTI